MTHVYTRSSSRVGWMAEVRESTPDQTPGPSLLFTSLPIYLSYSFPISNLSSSSHNVIYYAKHNMSAHSAYTYDTNNHAFGRWRVAVDFDCMNNAYAKEI